MIAASDVKAGMAILENGVEILVPHFVETGDLVRVETEKAKYLERITDRKI